MYKPNVSRSPEGQKITRKEQQAEETEDGTQDGKPVALRVGVLQIPGTQR